MEMNASKLYLSHTSRKKDCNASNMYSLISSQYVKDLNFKRSICIIVGVGQNGHSKHFDFVVEQCLDPIQVLL